MQGAFCACGQDHGGEGEVLGLHRVGVFRYTRGAGANVAHLRTAVLGIVIGLKLQSAPVVAARGTGGQAARHPLSESHACWRLKVGCGIGLG